MLSTVMGTGEKMESRTDMAPAPGLVLGIEMDNIFIFVKWRDR